MLSFYFKPEADKVIALLKEAGLPYSDIESIKMAGFVACEEKNAIAGIVGLEVYGPDALLRSLVVKESARGSGLGKKLVKKIEEYGAQKGVRNIYLLTTTARVFFEKLGYKTISRELAPESIKRTTEFSEICPSNSDFMLKKLSD